VKHTIIVAALVLAACGASPTAPAPTVAQPPTQNGKDPTPPADPPTTPPAPTPPAPPPAPAPTPTPPPSQRTILHATTISSHWYPNAAFTLPDRFDVVIENNTVTIATLDPLPFGYYKSDDEFLVQQRDFAFSVQGGRFTFTGVAGEATGTIAK